MIRLADSEKAPPGVSVSGAPELLGDWVERWARIEPGREALVVPDQERRVTYVELHRSIQEAQAWLVRAGVRAGDRVAILAQNRPEHVELLFACARLGAIMVPLNWRLAAPEMAFILEDCAPKVLLVEAELQQLLPAQAPCTRLESSGAPWHAGPGSTAEAPSSPEARGGLPLMILYTSGTTGRSKGAVLTQRSMYWNSVNTGISWDLSGSDATLTHAPFFHTGGWNVLTLPLLHRGGRVVLCRKFDPGDALRLIDDEKITMFFAVPTMYEMMKGEARFATASLATLRFAISGGAPCPAEISEAFLARGVRFKQGYGLTEVGPNCFVISLTDAAGRPDSVGFPIHNEEIRIVGDGGKDCAADEVGELHLRGPHVFGGYWKNPEATRAALVDGWFHTGDLVRRDAQGFTFIVGRKKEMFISGGENVYPAEVERVLHLHPGVKQAAVIGMPDPKWGEVGCAFIVREAGEAGATTGAEELKQHCNAHLARYKVPKKFEFLDAMPLNATGKIAKTELKARSQPS